MNYNKLKTFFENDRFAANSGIKIIEIKKGFCKATMKIEDRHLNAANVVQGGAIFTLADLAFAAASNSHGTLSLAINVNISFLKGKANGVLFAIAKEVCEPEKLGAYDVMVIDEKDEIIARFNGITYRKNEQILAESSTRKLKEKSRNDFITSVINSTKSQKANDELKNTSFGKGKIADKNTIIETIIDTIKSSDLRGVSRKEILQVLIGCFPENDPIQMKSITKDQVPYRISKERFLLEKIGTYFRVLK